MTNPGPHHGAARPLARNRPGLTVVDCTIRDGGLMNDSQFSLECVQAVYHAVCRAGVHVVELGYRNSRKRLDPAQYGAWRFCDDDLIRQVVGPRPHPATRIAVMMDAHKSDPDDLQPAERSPVDLVRCATYLKDLDQAIGLERDARAKGYGTALNVMSISTAPAAELDEALCRIKEETRVEACYIVDSFGNLHPEDLDALVARFKRRLPGVAIGIHAHNNQQLAFANTLHGLKRGATYLDATLYGLGRGAGNCNLELLLGFLNDPRFDLRPVLEVIASHILPLQKDLAWGYSVPYLVTGLFNRQQEAGMELMARADHDPDKFDFRGFYERQREL